MVNPLLIRGALKGAGKLLKGAGKAAKGALGMKGSRGRSGRRRGFSITKATNQLIRAKLRGRIMREKLKVVNYIK